MAATPRPRGCDRCRSAVPPLRRWVAAGASPDGQATSLMVVLFTCGRCEAECAGAPSVDDHDGAA